MTRYDTFSAFNMTGIVMAMIGIIMMIIVFIVMIVIIFSKFGPSIHQNNNNAPVTMVDAVVIAKRQDMTHHGDGYSPTRYFVTFQADDGRRAELEMKGEQYGLLIEGDYGKLTYQGNRYIGFTRT